MPCRRHAAVMAQPHLPPSCPAQALPATGGPGAPAHTRGIMSRRRGEDAAALMDALFRSLCGGKALASESGRSARCRSDAQSIHERFAIEKGRARGGGSAPPALNRAEKPRFFLRNDSPYGLKRKPFQTENARGQRPQETLSTQDEKACFSPACTDGRAIRDATVRCRSRSRCSRRSCGPARPARRRSPAPRRGTSIRHCDGRAPRR